MSSPAEETFRTELEAQRDTLLPEIAGFQFLIRLPFPAVIINELNAALSRRQRRLQLINTILTNLDSVDADGYPDLPKDDVDQTMLDEIQTVINDINRAFGELELPPVAGGNISIPPFKDLP